MAAQVKRKRLRPPSLIPCPDGFGKCHRCQDARVVSGPVGWHATFPRPNKDCFDLGKPRRSCVQDRSWHRVSHPPPTPPHAPRTPHGGPGVLSPSGGNTSRVRGWLVLPSFTHLPVANRLILITTPHSQCRSRLSFACGAPGEQNDRFLTSALQVFSLKHFTS